MLARPTEKVVLPTLITGAKKRSAAQIARTSAEPMTTPTLKSKGSETSVTAGNRVKTATKVPIFGRTRSWYRIGSVGFWLGTVSRLRCHTMSEVRVLITAPAGFEPVYAKPGDAGADLRSSVAVTVPSRSRLLVPTGVSIALPDGYVGLVHPRSGLAVKHGITVLNTPGTIDAGYRGEIMVILYNTSDTDFEIAIGDRIAQLLIQEVEKAIFVAVEKLPDSERGETGFGSSGRA